MSYYRYTRLQQYINGQPTEVYKKGERADEVTYNSYESCMATSDITRWVSIPQTVCYDGDLWSMEKEQISYDGGTSWSDTGNSRRASVIEQSSAQCFMSDWRVVPGEYICMMYAKWSKEAEYLSYDGGKTWTATGNIRRGETVIEPLSADCGVIYQWIPTGEYICQGYNKYMKEKQVYSTDNGSTWTDTGNRRTGGLIEADSEYCGYEQYIYQWVDVAGEYVCQGTTKFKKQKEQRSSDNGQTWEDTGNTRQGEVIEVNSFDCGYVAYRWVSDTGYVCVGYDKYNKEKEQSSTDGTNWTDTGNTRAGSTLIESLSTDCGVAYRWITVPNEYVCSGYDKYSKEKEQYSTDGTTWVDTGNTRTGSVIEQDSYDCGYDPSIVPLTLVSPTNINNLEFRHSGDVSSFEISYKFEGSDTWTRSTSDISINVPANKRVYFKGSFTTTGSIGSFYVSSGKVSVRGNIMSLIYNDNFLNQTSLAGKNYIFKKLFAMLKEHITDADKLTLPATTLSEGCYYSMFDNGWGLTKIPALPATTLTDYCYTGMFNGCDHLQNVPTDLLPATTMAAHCYKMMFSSCEKLINPPALPATTLADSCYYMMFRGCDDLATAPELPATTLAPSCYHQMFFECYKLTVAPVLPAPTLVQGCYREMFYRCTHLIDVTCCATDISAKNCILGWLDNINTIGIFHKDASATWTAGADGIPRGWTVDSCDCGHDYSTDYLTTEALESGNISLNREVSSNYQDKYPLTNIQYSKNDGSWTPYTYNTLISVVNGDKIRWKAQWNDGVSYFMYRNTFKSTGRYRAYGNPLSLLLNNNFSSVTSLTSYSSAFAGLFLNETKLVDITNISLPATTLSYECYTGMFQGCTSLTFVPSDLLPATTVAYDCYMQMFADCTSLTTAPVLPATTLVIGCYMYMFNGCTSLNSVTCCATNISATNCTKEWLNGVSSTGTFTKAAGVTWPSSNSGIPKGWTVVETS